MRFVLSAATSATLLFLVTLSSFAPAAVVGTAFDVTPDKAGFLDGAGGSKTKESSTTNEDGATTRIVGGDMADKTRYPYYAALFDGDYFVCGGSLIRPNVVITAAHCVAEYAEYLAIFVNFTGYADQSYAHKRNVIEVVIHQTYNTSDTYLGINDIALLFLDSPVTTEITPLQLNSEVGVPTDGQVLKAIGLGYTYANRTNPAEDLMEVDLPKVNDESCKGSWYDYYEDEVDTKTTVCAGGEQGKDTSAGDSGGPLVITGASPKNDVLVGLTSYGPPGCCGEEGIPGVYTRISAFVDWIEGTLSCFNSTTCTSSPSFSPTASFSPTVAPTPPPPLYLPGPTANIVVSLKTDDFPQESALWYHNVCNGDLTILLDVDDLDEQQDKLMNLNFSVALSTGIYQFVLFDNLRNGIENGGWSVIDASNMILFQNDEFTAGTSDKSGLIIVGDKDSTKCPDVLLPGPNATVHILLSTDRFPGETSLGYKSLCNGVETPINSSSVTENNTQYNIPVQLSTGEYEFYIRDDEGDGLYDNYDGLVSGVWSVILAGDVNHYGNLRFVGKEDTSGSPLVVGSGCGSTRPAATTTSSSSVAVTKKLTMLSQTAAFLWIAIVAFW